MNTTVQRPTLSEQPTNALETDDPDFVGNDRGSVPLVHDGEVLTDNREIHARQSQLENYRDLLQEADNLTRRDKVKRYKENIDKLEESQVIEWPDADVPSKRAAIQTHVNIDLSGVDKRLLTTILVASQRENVRRITANRKNVKVYLTDDTMKRTSGNYVELSKVGDGVVIQGRCEHDGDDVCRSFPTTCLQENEILETAATMISGKEWGMF